MVQRLPKCIVPCKDILDAAAYGSRWIPDILEVYAGADHRILLLLGEGPQHLLHGAIKLIDVNEYAHEFASLGKLPHPAHDDSGGVLGTSHILRILHNLLALP